MYLATSDTAYAGWQPVRIDAGYGGSSNRGNGEGFFTNSTGLQWSSNPGDAALDTFGGWIICDWWHGKQQNMLLQVWGSLLILLSWSQGYRSSSSARPTTTHHFRLVVLTSISDLKLSKVVIAASREIFHVKGEVTTPDGSGKR